MSEYNKGLGDGFTLGLANGGGSPTGEGAYIEDNTLWIPPSFVESFDGGELILKAEYAELVNGILSVKGSTEPTIDEDVQYIGIKNHTPQLVKDVRIGVLTDLTTANKTSVVAAINEVNADLDSKADADDVYLKSEIYSDDEIDTKLNAKANVADVYAKTETYNKTEVDDKISSELANYIGLFNSVSELPHTSDIQNNDYANVLSEGIYKRYKYNASNDTWTEEFTINNSPFTAAQWDALNSGIDEDKVDDYDVHIADMDNPHSVTKAQVGLGNVDNTSDMAKPVSTAQAEAINAKYAKPETGIPKTDLSSAVQASLAKADGSVQTESDPTVPSWAKQSSKPTYSASEIIGLSAVATSGNYNDLSNKPTSLPADGGNADTVDNKHIVVSSTIPTVDDTSVITIVIPS